MGREHLEPVQPSLVVPQMFANMEHAETLLGSKVVNMATEREHATFQRLQFRTATSNNGKRRTIQQYFVVIANVYAVTDKGVEVEVGRAESDPIAVRGRSPGHYAEQEKELGRAIGKVTIA